MFRTGVLRCVVSYFSGFFSSVLLRLLSLRSQSVMAQQLNYSDHLDGTSPEIYVAYSEEDDSDFLINIIDNIEERGIKCYVKNRDEITGQVFENLCEEIGSCRLVLLLYSERCLKDKIIKMLLILSLQNTVEKEKLTLVLLLHGIDKENIPKELYFVPHVYSNEENYFEKLMDKLKAPSVSMDHLLPVGNIAFGLVWSYYYGYLKLILPELPDRIEKWVEKNSSKTKFIPKRLYIVLPTHANYYSSLSEQDECIKEVDTLPTLETNRSGTAGRKYKNTIYKICKPDKEYYVVAEYAGSLNTMSDIKNGQLAGLTESDFSNQVYLFKEKLSEILEYQAFPNNCCTFVISDKENKKSLSDVFIETIEKDQEKIESENANPKKIIQMDHSVYNQEIYVGYCEDNLNFVEEIVKKIEKKGFNCYYKDRDEICGQEPENYCQESQSRRVLFIYTKDFLKNVLINFFLYHSLQCTAESKELTFMFLFHDIKREEIPINLEFVHHVFTYESNYFESMLEKLSAPCVSVDHLLPVGNISSGLSWSFYYGYLKLIMPEIPKKIDDWSKNNPSIIGHIPRRIYILLPTNAHCYSSLDKVDDCIKMVKTLETLEIKRSGNIARSYKNTMYEISKPEKNYYCIAEYATPVNTMSEMEKGQVAGLQKSALIREVQNFEEKLSAILKHKDCPDNCCTLVICDDTQPLSDFLVKAIENDLKEINSQADKNDRVDM